MRGCEYEMRVGRDHKSGYIRVFPPLEEYVKSALVHVIRKKYRGELFKNLWHTPSTSSKAYHDTYSEFICDNPDNILQLSAIAAEGLDALDHDIHLQPDICDLETEKGRVVFDAEYTVRQNAQ